MPDFNKIHAATMGTEGGYSNNPADAGGETYKGIARKMHPNWQGWKFVDGVKVRVTVQPHYGTSSYRAWVKYLDGLLAQLNQLQRTVVDFYFVNFWNANGLGLIEDAGVAAWIYDHIVNAGARGIMWAQLAASVTPDGKMGPKSLAAINAADPGALLVRMEDIAATYRLDKAHNNPSQLQFLAGWLKRDGQPDAIIDMVKQAAADGKLDDSELAKLKQTIATT